MKQVFPSALNKMLAWLAFGFALVSIFISIYLVFAKNDAIVYVDSMKLVSNYKGSVKAKSEYEKKVGAWNANVDTLATEFNRDVMKYQSERDRLTEKERRLSEELLATKKNQLENYKSAIAENANTEDKKVTAQLYREITDFLTKYGKDHGYDYVMGATSMGNIIYAKDGRDITDDALKQLNEQYHNETK